MQNKSLVKNKIYDSHSRKQVNSSGKKENIWEWENVLKFSY